jgi:aldose 1-epimerase
MALVCSILSPVAMLEPDFGTLDTLHGGAVGYDARPWTVVKQTSNSVTFSLVDPNGDQGFPGTVTTTVSYTVSLLISLAT